MDLIAVLLLAFLVCMLLPAGFRAAMFLVNLLFSLLEEAIKAWIVVTIKIIRWALFRNKPRVGCQIHPWVNGEKSCYRCQWGLKEQEKDENMVILLVSIVTVTILAVAPIFTN